jgi:hypothetical protein
MALMGRWWRGLGEAGGDEAMVTDAPGVGKEARKGRGEDNDHTRRRVCDPRPFGRVVDVVSPA